ncbi:MAG: hypothetical protein ACRDU4_10635, partial [Mycobacterium sp.]
MSKGLPQLLAARVIASSVVPQPPVTSGVSTWMSAGSIPMTRGIESPTSWVTRYAASAVDAAATKTASC